MAYWVYIRTQFWWVGCGFNCPQRHYFSLYSAITQSEEIWLGSEDRQNIQTTASCTCCKGSGPLPCYYRGWEDSPSEIYPSPLPNHDHSQELGSNYLAAEYLSCIISEAWIIWDSTVNKSFTNGAWWACFSIKWSQHEICARVGN